MPVMDETNRGFDIGSFVDANNRREDLFIMKHNASLPKSISSAHVDIILDRGTTKVPILRSVVEKAIDDEIARTTETFRLVPISDDPRLRNEYQSATSYTEIVSNETKD